MAKNDTAHFTIRAFIIQKTNIKSKITIRGLVYCIYFYFFDCYYNLPKNLNNTINTIIPCRVNIFKIIIEIVH